MSQEALKGVFALSTTFMSQEALKGVFALSTTIMSQEALKGVCTFNHNYVSRGSKRCLCTLNHNYVSRGSKRCLCNFKQPQLCLNRIQTYNTFHHTHLQIHRNSQRAEKGLNLVNYFFTQTVHFSTCATPAEVPCQNVPSLADAT